MSTVKVNAITDASGGNTATINSMTPTADSLQGFRNRIINGAMMIDQRNAGAAVTASGSYPVDRFVFQATTSGAISAQQSTSVVPTGFTSSLGITITTADASIAANDFLQVQHIIEGNNVADLGFGTANAKTVTISFWVRGSVTGTYCVVIGNSSSSGTGAPNRSYVAEYTISSANTWEYKTITIAGDTSGTWMTNNTRGFIIRFGLAAGTDFQQTAGSWGTVNAIGSSNQTQLLSTLNATWYITGVQLEVGSTATPFERRDYGRELIMCQRYCRTLNSDGGTDKAMFSGVAYLNNTIICSYTFPTMRTAPTAVITNPTQLDVVTSTVTTANNTLEFGSVNLTPNSAQPAVTNTGTPFTAGHGAVVRFDGASVVFSAEL